MVLQEDLTGSPETGPPRGDRAPGGEKASDSPEGVHNTIMDLHLELLCMYHRVCLKLAQTVNGGRGEGGQGKAGSGKGQRSRPPTDQRLVRCLFFLRL